MRMTHPFRKPRDDLPSRGFLSYMQKISYGYYCNCSVMRSFMVASLKIIRKL